MEKKHAREVAELHHVCIKSPLRDLGRRMCRVFYEAALKTDDNFGFVYVENATVLGFALATKDNTCLFNSPSVFLELLLSLLRKPFLIKKILSHLSNRFPPTPEVAYIAVEPRFRNRGIGQKLLAAQHEAFRKRGIPYYMVRVDADNGPSLALHQKVGAKIKGEFTEGGIRRLILYNRLDA